MVAYSEKGGRGEKRELALDQPSKLVVMNGLSLIAAVEKKCITLYRIYNGRLILKDFDSIGIGSRLMLVELRELRYKGKDYLLVFGNEEEEAKTSFKCLVYEISREKLRFVKKASIL